MTAPEQFLQGRVTLHCGDCIEVMASMPANSVDSIVCDPPYHLASIVKRFGGTNAAEAKHGTDGAFKRASAGFMGKQWDGGDIAFQVETWRAALRVLKPGAHLAAFGASRGYHRMACAIEDAGFEIRDSLMWVYGTGFPKSHDVSKGIDKAAGAEPITTGEFKRASIQRNGEGDAWEAGAFASHPEDTKQVAVTRPATDAAREWEGWGTALKPAFEPIVLARKPLSEKTVAANVLRWRTGALNIVDTRVGDEVLPEMRAGQAKIGTFERENMVTPERVGRWPANVVHDGSEEVVGAFPTTGPSKAAARGGKNPNPMDWGNDRADGHIVKGHDDNGGSAARFFYSAKASKADRAGSKHPTVKPVDLMQWLCRLVTPPKGTVLDPFAGTGTTGEAAYREGFNAVLVEREAEYQADIRRRMALVLGGPDERRRESIKARTNGQPADAGPLFGGQPTNGGGGMADRFTATSQTRTHDWPGGATAVIE